MGNLGSEVASSSSIASPVQRSTVGLPNTCLVASVDSSVGVATDPRVTIKAAAIDRISAGIWLTRPSPIVSLVNIENVSLIGSCA